MSEPEERFAARLEKMNQSWRGAEHTSDAAAYVHDTLELAWLAASDLFGDKVTPEIAVAIYDRIDEERLAPLRRGREAPRGDGRQHDPSCDASDEGERTRPPMDPVRSEIPDAPP